MREVGNQLASFILIMRTKMGPRRFLFAVIFSLTLLYLLNISVQQLGRIEPSKSTASSAPSTTSLTQQATKLPKWIDSPKKQNEVPGWCDVLRRHPRDRERNWGLLDCGRGLYGAVCRDGKPRFFSQFNQDVYTYMNHFRYLRRPGTYLDVATNEPVRISNTYFYDKCLKWGGVCIEANSKYFEPIRTHRSCALVRKCVGDVARNVTFVMHDGLGGITDTNKNLAMKSRRELMSKSSRIHMQCVRTSDALQPLGVTHIDLLSLDVEGHELPVLRGIDWLRTTVNVIVTESTSAEMSKLLDDLGFRALPHDKGRGMHTSPQGHLISDTVYVHKSVTWGSPV